MHQFLIKISFQKLEIVSYNANSKFRKDAISIEGFNYLVTVFGVLFKNKVSHKQIKNLLNQPVVTFNKTLSDLRGTFSGIIHNKQNNEFYAFVNQTGDKQLFYYKDSDEILLSDSITEITNYLTRQWKRYTLDERGVYFLLTYGFMLEDYTLIKEIRKINAGQYLKIKNGKIEIHQYHKFSNNPDKTLYNEKEAIEGIDHYFKQAIKRQFDKDVEYGFKHAVGLSGGLDSRMTSWVAHDMGYTDQLNFTFSQSDYLDETIPKKIAADLKHEWVFKALDNGLFLNKVDEITDITYGNVLYYGLAHAKSLLELLNWQCLGLIHTGQLGDSIIGTFYSQPKHNRSYKLSDGAYSSLLINRIEQSWLKHKYENEEIFKLYTRAFTGANQGLLASQLYSETFSPFYDVDFLEFAYSIPVELRFKHNLYFKWMQEKYPDSCNYWWEKTKNYPGEKGKSFKYILDTTKPHEVPGKVLKALVRKTTGKKNNLGKKQRLNSKTHMNPLNYWYNTNPYINQFFHKQYNERFFLLDKYPEIQKDVAFLWNNGDMMEKIQVLSLLSALNKYFY